MPFLSPMPTASTKDTNFPPAFRIHPVFTQEQSDPTVSLLFQPTQWPSANALEPERGNGEHRAQNNERESQPSRHS